VIQKLNGLGIMLMELITGQFNDSFQPIMDGVANVTKNYAYWLNKKDVKTYVITPFFPKYKDMENMEVLRYLSTALPKRPPYRLGIHQLDFSFYRRINRIPFDIVHAHCPFSSGQIALQIARRRRIPIVTTFHSKYYDDFIEVVKMEKVAQFMIRRIISFYNKVDYVWTVNKATVDTLRYYGFRGNIDVMYNGADISPCEDTRSLREIANGRLNLKNDELMFLFVGQHIWQKNLELLVKALRSLKDRGVEFRMIFAGKGYAREELEQMVRELGLGENVRFIGVVQDREYLKALFARANLFLFPSLYDTSGIVIQEAAAVKCPSLVIENSNAAEGILDSHNGFLSANDAEAYSRKIEAIISDRKRLASVGENAQSTIYRSWEQVIDDVKERYMDIVSTYRKIKRADAGI
jgi:glycosyltransferase involved in cell wall biosynthesis